VSRQAVMATPALLALLLVLALFIDRPLALLLHQTVPDGAKPVLEFLTRLGESHWYLWPTGLLGLGIAMAWLRTEDSPRRRNVGWVGGIAFFLFASIALSGLAADLVKILVGRARPKLLFGDAAYYGFDPFSFGADHWSFPSGHATTFFSLAMALALLRPRASVPLLAVAGLLTLTRPLVGAHYLSDVIGGGVIGTTTALLLSRWLAGRKWVFQPSATGAIEAVPPPWRAGDP
jgi:membrane-associated phospholipid phosphatase